MDSGVSLRETESDTWGGVASSICGLMSPVGDYDELLGLRYTAMDLVLEFGIFLWARSALCNGDLIHRNSFYGGSWDFIRNTYSREGLGLSASGWVSSPHQVPAGWGESTRGNWCSGTDLLKGSNPFPRSVPALTKPQTRAQWEKWTVSNKPPDSSHRLAFFQTFYFDVSQVYSKGEETNALRIYMLFIWKIQLTLYHICAGLFPFFLHSLHIHTFFPPKSSRSKLQRS